MPRYLAFLLLSLAPTAALADVWKWVDVDGRTHFVETRTPIFWWMDEGGNVQYSDSPDHEDAVAIELVWHSSGRLQQAVENQKAREEQGAPESPSDRAAREAAEAVYCQRVQEIYESYEKAPRIYRSNSDGKREYLSQRETRALIRDVRKKRDTLCR